MPEDDFDKSFSNLISKLGHPVEEIRLRALESLQAKLDLKIIADVDILQYKYLYIKLLEWFNFPSPPKREVVLDIILKLSKNESAAYNLHSVGAVDFFNSLRVDLTPELECRVDQILENILAQHSITQSSSSSNLSRSNSTSCQLVRSHIQAESRDSTILQSPIFNFSQHQPELSFHRHEFTTTRSQYVPNQSGMKGILKATAPPSICNLLSTFDESQNGSTCQFITLFPLIHLTQSDRTVLTNLENALLSRDDPLVVISHCHFLSNVVLNDFPAELFLQRSFIVKRLLALLNENHDDLIKAALSCLKDYAINLQRRIKILRDPASFCPKYNSNSDALKEQILDDFNNTLTSARSVSSISSATSNGYRNPSQWSLKYDEPPQVDQPSSFDILDFCYALLIGTLDLLRRLTLKDCLHTCLQLNNSVCHIIDLFVKHNYGTMNFEYYSVLFYRLHSLIKQQLTIGYTFQSRTIYIHCLHVFSTLLHTIEWSEGIVNQLPQEFNELVYYILMDECFNLSYPHIRERLLSIAEKFDKDNYQVYTKSNDICCSFSAACQILIMDENRTQNYMNIVKYADDALLGLPYHLNFNVVKRFMNVCSKISTNNSKCDLSEKNFSLDVLIKYMTHESAEIRSAVYCSIAMLVASRLSVEETVKTTNKLKTNSTLAADFDDTQFVCNVRIITELCVNGINDLASKVSDYCRLVLLHLLQSKLLVSNEYWRNFMANIAILLPHLQCYANKIDPLGQCILALTSDTEREKESLLTLNQRFQASLRYLFSKDKDVRKTGYRQCVGYLLANTRIRLDDFYQFYPADKLFDLFVNAQSINNAEILTKDYVNVESFLRVYTIFTDRNKIDASVRKSALEQMAMMLTDPSLHSSFLNHGGFEKVLEELRLNLKRDDIVCSTDYTSTVPACTKIIRLLIQYNRNFQKKFSLDNELLKLLFKITVCCHSDLEIVSNLTYTLVLLLFDRSLHITSLSDQEFQQQTFSIDFLLAKNFQFPMRVPIQTSTSSIVTTALNRPDPLREPIVQQKFRFVWNTLWHGNVQQLDQDMDTKSFDNDKQVEFQSSMILNENDRKCFSLTYTRRTIRLELNLLNESNNHESVIETLNAIRCLLLLVTHDNVHLIDFNQLGAILDKYFKVVPSSCQDEKLLQSVFELLEQISYGLHLSIKNDDHQFFNWFKHILLNPFISLVASNKDFVELRQTKRDLLKKLFRFLSSFYSHSNVSSEFFTDKLFANILNYVRQSSSHTFSKLTLITGAMDVLHHITTKSQWFVIFDNEYLQQMTDLLIAVIETFHEGRKEASSGFMAYALIRSSSQTLLNVILAMKSTISTSNRRQEMSLLQEWLEATRTSFDWLRNLWSYKDTEIRVTSYALTAIFIMDDSGRDILFSTQNRLEEAQLLTILVDEDECSLVKEQVCNVLINLTYTLIDDEAKLATGNSIVTLPELISAINDCDFMQRIGSSVFSNLYPFVALDLDALRMNQTTSSPVSPLFLGNLCSFLFNLNMLGVHNDTLELITLLLSFLDVRPLESEVNRNVTTHEYHVFLDNMFYMYTIIAQYLRLTLESNLNMINEAFTNENLIQIISLLAYFPENNYDRSKNFWQTKINLAHLIIHILLQQCPVLYQLTNNTLVHFASELFSILTLPLQTMINGSISVAISILLQLLSLSIAQCTLDQEKETWKKFFDHSTDKNGIKIFNQLVLIYENRLNTESNDTLKLTVSNMIKSLLNISVTAKQEAIDSGFIESQIDHLKRIQTKLTLFSLQSDKCVSKDDVLIDECVQVLSILNNLSFDCSSAKDILSSSGLIPFLHQLWCWAIVDIQLLNVLLLLLTTLTAKHRKSCVSVCSTVLPSASALVVQIPDQQRPLSNLLSYILRLITKASLSATANNNITSSKNQIIEMAFDVIQNCSLEIEGRSIVYKLNFFQMLIDHFERVSRDINRFDRRFLDVIINVSFFTDGQTNLLKSAEIFAIIIRLAQTSSSAILQRQALLILRNLAFSSTNKARIVAEPKSIPTIMSHVLSKTSDTAYIGLTALWALIVDAQKGKVAVRSSNVLPALFDVKTQQRNKENLLCYHAVSNVIQLLTED
ncbi:unnamed protein product [Rotaria magnacalcarata]|uniref:Rotatin N-terminal domain-containing protein n=2 Tax=Rotaria magnacalcarata TaxID=392030 RepID=A0A816CH83_9BILA|nr:unnamed protein product [Rotaria magnacalcarata]CAF1624533.1 unnamed protein product [Rotaria magnacalcarata]CAF3803411.1 unnamed protein product [Rotaria magnacalcarata]CAF3883329.1 unnamed protein product [Rotaria magnacalcarata]